MKYKSLIIFSFICGYSHAEEINVNLAGSPAIYNNGPLVSSPGTGLGGADESIVENITLGMTSFGTGHQVSSNLRVADDFEVTNDNWYIDSIDFFAYQSNEIASTITAVNLRIWDGIPGAVGSNIVFGDTTTNLLNTTTNSGILRVNESTAGANNERQIAQSNVTVNTNLTTGTYWLDWQADGSGASGPFVPHITIPGQTVTGNALQSADGGLTYSALNDLGSATAQGLPFILNGSIQGGVLVSIPTLSNGMMILFILLMLIPVLRYSRKYQKNISG